MAYKTPAALEMAMRAAARKSPQDTSKAIAGFYFHRLLCRVFSEEEPCFVLKGGLSTLARIPSARSTRDIDLTTSKFTIDEAVEELKRLAAIDLGDFLTYRFEKITPTRVEDEYREGRKVSFTPILGGSEKQCISIDLVTTSASCGKPDIITPSDRLDINGLEVCDYAVYPIVGTMSDKMCAILETHDGRCSSRVKDLVDLAVYLTTTAFSSDALADAITMECALRKLGSPDFFSVPDAWHSTEFKAAHAKLVRETVLPSEFEEMDNTEALAKSCFDPILANTLERDASWNCKTREWNPA